MNELLLKALLEAGLQVFQSIQALRTADPVAYQAALAKIGADHKAALDRLEAAAKP